MRKFITNFISGSTNEIHSASHSLDQLAGDHVICQISILGHLHRSEHGQGYVTPADHRERFGRRKIRRAGGNGNSFFPSIDQIGVHLKSL